MNVRKCLGNSDSTYKFWRDVFLFYVCDEENRDMYTTMILISSASNLQINSNVKYESFNYKRIKINSTFLKKNIV